MTVLWHGCLMKSRNWFSCMSTWVKPRFSGGIRVAHLFRFLCCVFCFVFYSCDLCIQCFQCLLIAHSWLLLRFSLMFIFHIHVVRSLGLLLLSCFHHFVLSFWHANRESVSIFYVILLIYCLKVWNFNSLCKFCNWKMVKWIYLAKQF